MVTRGEREEGKGNCFETLPQLVPCHHAMLSLAIFLSFCLSCRVLSNIPASLQCLVLPALLPLFNPKILCFLKNKIKTNKQTKKTYLHLLAYFYPCWSHFKWKAIYRQHLYFHVHAQYCLLFFLKTGSQIRCKGCLPYINYRMSSILQSFYPYRIYFSQLCQSLHVSI